jgi:dihydrofolate reductase
MGKLTVFQFMTLDGYYADPDADTSWHQHDPGGDSSKYAAEMLGLGSTLIFGRLTYEFMASFWPTPMANVLMPDVATGMNDADKIVFSRTLESADWKNTTIVREDAVKAVKRMKASSAKELTVLGSGSLLRQFSENGLVDEFQFMIDPLVLGEGRSIFKGVKHRLNLKLVSTRTLRDGPVLLYFRPS